MAGKKNTKQTYIYIHTYIYKYIYIYIYECIYILCVYIYIICIYIPGNSCDHLFGMMSENMTLSLKGWWLVTSKDREIK